MPLATCVAALAARSSWSATAHPTDNKPAFYCQLVAQRRRVLCGPFVWTSTLFSVPRKPMVPMVSEPMVSAPIVAVPAMWRCIVMRGRANDRRRCVNLWPWHALAQREGRRCCPEHQRATDDDRSRANPQVEPFGHVRSYPRAGLTIMARSGRCRIASSKRKGPPFDGRPRCERWMKTTGCHPSKLRRPALRALRVRLTGSQIWEPSCVQSNSDALSARHEQKLGKYSRAENAHPQVQRLEFKVQSTTTDSVGWQMLARLSLKRPLLGQ
jgi:hypothetical protein